LSSFGPLQYKKDVDKVEQVQWRATKLLRGWSTRHRRRWWESWAYRVQRRDGFEGDLIAVYTNLMGL